MNVTERAFVKGIVKSAVKAIVKVPVKSEVYKCTDMVRPSDFVF